MNFEKDNPHCGRRCDFPEITETASAVEICDNFGQKRFEARMYENKTPYAQNCNPRFQQYTVDVISFWGGERPQTVLCRQFPGQREAKEFFDATILQYRSLVIAETRDWQDARIYADRTGYRKTCPECCENCKWAKRPVCGWEFQSGLRREDFRLVCTNSEIYRSEARPGAPLVHPDVQPDCVCDYFERRVCGK